MTLDSTINLLISMFPWGYVKLALIITMFIYVVFASVIVRQEQLMRKVINVTYMSNLRPIALMHFFVSLIVFFLTLVLL
jgi:hypothetical protein